MACLLWWWSCEANSEVFEECHFQCSWKKGRRGEEKNKPGVHPPSVNVAHGFSTHFWCNRRDKHRQPKPHPVPKKMLWVASEQLQWNSTFQREKNVWVSLKVVLKGVPNLLRSCTIGTQVLQASTYSGEYLLEIKTFLLCTNWKREQKLCNARKQLHKIQNWPNTNVCWFVAVW